MIRNNRRFIILNLIIPLITGTIIYYLVSPDVMFVKLIDKLIGRGIHFTSLSQDNMIARFVRCYLLDMLWGYALVFALYLILGNNAARAKRVFYIAFLFSVFMEVLQLTPFAEGTFDYADIALEFLAEAIAVFIINSTYEEALI